MTPQEIKLELAKVAIQSDMPLQNIKEFYTWIMEEEPDLTKEQYKNIPIVILLRASYYMKRVTNICRAHNIFTVGELVSLGRGNFLKFSGIGRGCLKAVEERLAKQGVVDWDYYYDIEYLLGS